MPNHKGSNMINKPKTRAEAQEMNYGTWAAKYTPMRCAYLICEGAFTCQCWKKPGHGPGKLYCKQHADMA